MKKYFALLLTLVMAAGILLTAGCGGEKQQEKPQPKAKVTLRLAAAASLEQVFNKKLIPMFCQKHPEVTVESTYDSSGKLQMQIEQGLNADVFMSAAMKQMQALDKKGYMDSATVTPLLENKLVLIVPAEGKSTVAGFNDLAQAQRPAIGDPKSVPAGQYAKECLTKLQLWDEVSKKASLGTNVTEVLHWVAEGSADAGLVYATDAASTPKVKVVAEAPAGSLSKPVIYPVGVLKKAPQPQYAKDFAAFLQTEEALAAFREYGFAVAKK